MKYYKVIIGVDSASRSVYKIKKRMSFLGISFWSICSYYVPGSLMDTGYRYDYEYPTHKEALETAKRWGRYREIVARAKKIKKIRIGRRIENMV